MDPMSPWLVVLIGVGTVFSGLVMIILAIKVMTFFTGRSAKQDEPGSPVVKPDIGATISAAPNNETIPHGVLVAACSAAIAQTLGESVEGLRIRSIRRLGSVPQDTGVRERNVAIAAAIAESMNKTPDGLRLISIKRI